ncbi:unnamed protein product [Heterobilharzia americana]|nr:unnamed protein product [Heterobilharzia americana]CAH8482927.1 unnamed protein product [Heterobilharzia americana]
MNIDLGEKACSKLRIFICCFLRDLINEEGVMTNGVDSHDQNHCLPVKNTPSMLDNTRRVVMLSRDEVVALAAATAADKPNPVILPSSDGENVSRRIKQLRQTPLLANRPTVRGFTNKPVVPTEVKSPSAPILDATPIRHIQITHVTPRLESSQKTESFKNHTNTTSITATATTTNSNSNSAATSGLPILSAFLSQSSLSERKRHISAPSSAVNSGQRQSSIDNHFKPQERFQVYSSLNKDKSNNNNNNNSIPGTKVGITIKRQLSEAVISIRPATSRLSEDT